MHDRQPEKAFSLGKQAHQNGKSIHYNPYRNLKDHSRAYVEWEKGWNSAASES